jgi:hypothetical protein
MGSLDPEIQKLFLGSGLHPVYETSVGPRVVKIAFSNGDILEIGDEVIGPKSEFLPKYMRERLPDLPTDGLLSHDPMEPYRVTENKYYFLDRRLRDTAAGRLRLDSSPEEVQKYFKALGELDSESEIMKSARALSDWAKWRDKHSTKWVRLQRFQPKLVVWHWWQDFFGREYNMMIAPGKTVEVAPIDLEDLLRQISGEPQGSR